MTVRPRAGLNQEQARPHDAAEDTRRHPADSPPESHRKVL